MMKKKQITLNTKVSPGSKISIKALDFAKLPKKFNGSNYAGNTFLNLTKSYSTRGQKDTLSVRGSGIGKLSGIFVKPITSRTRNQNAIKLNVIPKTSTVDVRHERPSKNYMKNNKPFTKMFTQSLYVSYNNSSNTYRNTNKNEVTPGRKTFNLFSQISVSKSNSRNNSHRNAFVNSSTCSVFLNSKDSVNVTAQTMDKGKKKLINNNSIINSNSIIKTSMTTKNTTKLFNNSTIKQLSNENLNFKKLGIKFKKKTLLKKEEENFCAKDVYFKLMKIPLFKNFHKGQLFYAWKNYTFRNKKEFKYRYVYDLLDKTYDEYYKSGMIKKYNSIKKEENSWKNYEIKEEFLDVDETNKDNVLNSVYEKVLKTIKNLYFDNNIPIKSNSIYILELLAQKLDAYLKKIRYVLKYYYDPNKKAIIKKPSVTAIKEILGKINKLLERPNIKNKMAQEFIINNTKVIGTLNLNKGVVKETISLYLEACKEGKTKHSEDLLPYLNYLNIINDFTPLRIKKIENDLKELYKEIINCEQIICNSFINNDEYDILLYKINPVQYRISEVEKKLGEINEPTEEKDKKLYQNIIKNKEKFKAELEILLKKIKKSRDPDKYDEKNEDLKYLIPAVDAALVKYNILYTNEYDAINTLINNKDKIKISNKVKKILDIYTKKNNENEINLEYIHFINLYEKYIKFLNNKSPDFYEDVDIFNKILSYKHELSSLSTKLLSTIYYNDVLPLFTNLSKSDEIIDKMKANFLEKIKKDENGLTKYYNLDSFYKDFVSQFIKYDKDKENCKTISRATDNLEKIVFKYISLIKNNGLNLSTSPYNSNNFFNSSSTSINNSNDSNINNNLNNNNLISNLDNNKYRNNNNLLIKNINDYWLTKDQKILNRINDELKIKTFSEKNNTNNKESCYPYPRIYFLSPEKREYLQKLNKVGLNDICKYYSIVNPGQDLEIINQVVKPVVNGIKISSKNRKEFEIFKFNSPVSIQNYTSNSAKCKDNGMSYITNLFKKIDKEIEDSLIQQLLSALSSFSKKDFHKWVNTNFSQISICTLCLIFTNEISNLIAEGNSKSKAPIREYKLIIQKYQQWLNTECNYITNPLVKINITLTILSQMNMIESLIKNDVGEISSFNWLKYIRHLWDKHKKDVIIECGGWANYQMKQLNPFKPRMLLTPDTDKVFLFNSSCFREKSASIIKVINNKYNNDSYKEIFEEYCNMFWTNLISVNAIVVMEEDLKRIFDVCTIDKSWIFIDNLDYYNISSTNNINSLIYFSKFIQTLQQEVILNDIKFNDGEKMFCIMGCLNVDDQIKAKCEYLKGSSRILNFIKPDIEFYLKNTIGLYRSKDAVSREIKRYVEILMKYETIVRNKLTNFYFDFDFFNTFLINVTENFIKNNNNKNYSADSDKIYLKVLEDFSKNFTLSLNNSKIDEQEIINYFNKKVILYDKERIDLFKFLYLYSNDNMIKRTLVLKGFGRHFMLNCFKEFYFLLTEKQFNNININIVLENENNTTNLSNLSNLSDSNNFTNIYYSPNNNNNMQNLNNNNNICKNDLGKTIVLSPPKGKKFLEKHFDLFIAKLKKDGINLPDEFKMNLKEFINNVIKECSQNLCYYKVCLLFCDWLNNLYDFCDNKKKQINNQIILFNIIIECLLQAVAHDKNRFNKILEIGRTMIPNDLFKTVYSVMKKSTFFYFDVNQMSFRLFNNMNDYIKNFLFYLNMILGKNKFALVLSEYFANANKNIKLYDSYTVVITDNLYNLHGNEDIRNLLYVFIGFDLTFENQLVNKNLVSQNEMIKTILEKGSMNLSAKFSYLLSYFNVNSLNSHELQFIYNCLDRESTQNFDINYIQSPLKIIKNIINAFPKSVYIVKIDDNKLMKNLLSNQILKEKEHFYNDMEQKPNNNYIQKVNSINSVDYTNNNLPNTTLYSCLSNNQNRSAGLINSSAYNNMSFFTSNSSMITPSAKSGIFKKKRHPTQEELSIQQINLSEQTAASVMAKPVFLLNLSDSNKIYFDFCAQDLKEKIIKEILLEQIHFKNISNNIQYKIKLSDFDPEKFSIFENFEDPELSEIARLLNDIYRIPSEAIFKEQHPNSHSISRIFDKIFMALNIKKTEKSNDNYYNSRLLIQYLKYGTIKEDSLKYKCLSSLTNIFNNNSKVNDISILINNTLTNYKELISSKEEYINSKYYYFNAIKTAHNLNENPYNSVLEKIYLSCSNHFLFSLLLTFEIMVKNFEISVIEKNYILNYLKEYYVFPSDNVIKFKYENEPESFKSTYIVERGKALIEFYTKISKSINSKYLQLLNSSLDTNNNKYFYTMSMRKINRDIDKLLYYVTFVPDQSSSIFKYLINKYLLKIMNFGKFNVNVALRKPSTKENFIPITVKAFPSINLTNFLCSLSAYFEISFFIVRDCNIYNCEKKGKVDYGFRYLVDTGLVQLLKEGMKKGYWILICEKTDITTFMKIIWEIYNNFNSIKVHENFKLFFDEKLILSNCKKAIEDLTMIINIDNENVDDLEAAHDIWVNVLEEKLLTDSIMNATQKDVLEIIDNTISDKTNALDITINNNNENKTNIITNNSIISMKSLYNNNTTFLNASGANNYGVKNKGNLEELSDWTFLNNL